MCHVSALGSVCGSYTQCDAQEATDTDAGEMQVTVDDSKLDPVCGVLWLRRRWSRAENKNSQSISSYSDDILKFRTGSLFCCCHKYLITVIVYQQINSI